MQRILDTRPLEDYRLYVRFDDGVEGTIDLSDLVGKGVFQAWEDRAQFARVFIDPDTGTVAWPGGIDLCPDTIHRDLKDAQPVG